MGLKPFEFPAAIEEPCRKTQLYPSTPKDSMTLVAFLTVATKEPFFSKVATVLIDNIRTNSLIVQHQTMKRESKRAKNTPLNGKDRLRAMTCFVSARFIE